MRSIHRLYGFSALLLLSGCSGAANTVLYTLIESDTNCNNLAGLRIGMTQQAAWEIMREPEWEEQVNSPKGTFCIWYYITRPSLLGQARYVSRNLTPVVFSKGKLIGWGWHYYDYAIQRGYRPPSSLPKKPEPLDEDLEFEKALESPYPTAAAPQAPPPYAPGEFNEDNQPNQDPEEGQGDQIEEEASQGPTPPSKPLADDGSSPPPGYEGDDDEDDDDEEAPAAKPPAIQHSSLVPPRAGDTQTPPPPEASDEEEKQDPDARDREMMDDESEENFNFW